MKSKISSFERESSCMGLKYYLYIFFGLPFIFFFDVFGLFRMIVGAVGLFIAQSIFFVSNFYQLPIVFLAILVEFWLAGLIFVAWCMFKSTENEKDHCHVEREFSS